MGAWWPACTQRREARRRPEVASVRVRRDGFRGIRLLVLLTCLVIMTSGPIENLGFQGLRRGPPGRVANHSVAEGARANETPQAPDTPGPRRHLPLRRQAQEP